MGEEDSHEILSNFALLEELDNPKTEGNLKKYANKFHKDITDLVSLDDIIIIYS